MGEEERAALLNARVLAARIELEARLRANADREARGEAPAYGERELRAVAAEFGIDHNAAVRLLREGGP